MRWMKIWETSDSEVGWWPVFGMGFPVLVGLIYLFIDNFGWGLVRTIVLFTGLIIGFVILTGVILFISIGTFAHIGYRIRTGKWLADALAEKEANAVIDEIGGDETECGECGETDRWSSDQTFMCDCNDAICPKCGEDDDDCEC